MSTIERRTQGLTPCVFKPALLTFFFSSFTHFSYCEKPDNESDMGGVPHVEGGLNSDLYAVPVKRRQPKDVHKDQKDQPLQPSSEKLQPSGDIDAVDSEDKDENLPVGWEKHEGKLTAVNSIRVFSKTG